MKKLFVAALALSLCFTSQAQFSVAFIGGPQINSVKPAFSLNSDPVPVQGSIKYTGANFGFIGQAALDKKQSWFFRTGLLYSAKGSQALQRYDTSNIDFTNGWHDLETSTKLKISYIDIPINLLYKFPVKGQLKFLLGGGLQASVFYFGSIDYTAVKAYKTYPYAPVKPEYKEVFKNAPVESLIDKKTLHFSANALSGFEFKRTFVTVGYSYGLTSFSSLDDRSFKHKTLAFNVGILLGNRRITKVPVVQNLDQHPILLDLERPVSLHDTTSIVSSPDADGDGIPDSKDLCPNVPGNSKYKGCPVPDKDGDAIPDDQDECPDIAGETKYNGCPIPDSDGDGVNDEEDLCPIVAGDKDNHGCSTITKEEQEKTEYAAKSLQFEIYSARISSASIPDLNEVVKILKNNKTLKIRIEGHTSGQDSEPNRILSQERADSVRDYFIRKGIARNRIISIGMGSSKHISADGYLKNNPEDRRVEMFIL